MTEPRQDRSVTGRPEYPEPATAAQTAPPSGTGRESSASTPDTAGIATPPAITLPKGGGAIRGIGEKFTANPATGTGAFTIPIATSPGRSGFGPTLTLSYDSGHGNGPFGLGWSLGLPAITRRTEKMLPRYRDAAESDVFLLSGAEDLVPVLDDTHGWAQLDLGDAYAPGYRVDRYRPRIEGLFARIERWTRKTDGITHWRSITRDNVTTVYGATADACIADPCDPGRIFAWLISESFDDRGNAIVYDYQAEDSDNVDLTAANEANRTPTDRSANRYLKRVRYGNRTPRVPGEDLHARTDWMFEVVFDYGDHDPTTPTPAQVRPRLCRRDPFSTYKPGFEVRTYRLCQRVLMFHHFPTEPEVGADALVHSTDLSYTGTDQHQGGGDGRGGALASLLASVTHRGYRRGRGGTYVSRALPPVEFDYSPAEFHDTIAEVDPQDLTGIPAGLATPGTHWIDLDGEGIPGVLIQTPGAWSYKANLGAGRFAATQTLPDVPARRDDGSAGLQLLDLTATGQLDVVDYSGPAPGYYARSDTGGWEPFRTFITLPNLRWDDPNLRFLDLDGDGYPDILLTDTEALTWYPSRSTDGFGPGQRSTTDIDDDHGPRIVFADPDQSYQIADMSGDGLTDLVRIRNGEVAYWPNLGHGRFGAKIVMDHAPWFDTAEGFDQKRLQLSDVDGSGTTDLIYLEPGRARIWRNQAGNAFADPVDVATPAIDSLTRIAVADLLGAGTACLVWSSPLPADTGRSLRYIDLLAGNKPYLLVGMRNNLGAETHLTYTSSTKFYLADKSAGRPWVTRLPFPVHVVERVEVLDRISRNRFTSRYAYHHGYFDTAEREFRGFGMVEQFDTEHLDTLAAAPSGGATNQDTSHNVPPVLTKTWFQTGAYAAEAALTRRFDTEYWHEPALTDAQAEAMLLADTILPDSILHADASRTPFDPPTPEAREAARALKGAPLRTEVYAVDGSDAQARPYQVTESNYTIELLQPIAGNRHAVCLTHAREQVTLDYERTLYPTSAGLRIADPRVTHHITLDTDGYGNPLRTVAVAYPRRHPDPADGLDTGSRDALHTAQSTLLATLSDATYTNPIDTPTTHRTPLPAQTRTFELIHIASHRTDPAITNLFEFAEMHALVDAAGDGSHDLPPEDLDHTGATTAASYRRLLTHTRVLYQRDDLTGPLPLGHTDPHALPHQHYTLTFTPGLLARTYQRTRNGHVENLIPDRAADLGADGGYLAGDTLTAQGLFPTGDPTGCWWAPSGRLGYSPDSADPPATELAYAATHFYLPHRYIDPYGNTTTVSYDPYDLLVTESRDPLDNRTTVGTRAATGAISSDGHDYRVLAPKLITDPNRNRSTVTHDALGMVAGTAVMGKPELAEGDTLDGFEPDLDDTVIAAHLANPLIDPGAILGSATTRLVYDLHAYQRSSNDPHPQPVVAYTLARETHAADVTPGQQTKIQHTFSYTDGFGRDLQHKAQAEPGPGPLRDATGSILVDTTGQPVLTDHDVTPRWVGSGWTVYDNKANPIRKYEPFFTDTHHYEPDQRIGVSPIIFYDPLSRPIVTLHPDHTYDKTVFDPWRHTSYDVNDTCAPRNTQTGDPRTDPDTAQYVADYFTALPTPLGQSWQTWYQQRINNPTTPYEQQAAQKAAAHADTPATTHLDTLARAFLTVTHNRVSDPGHPEDGTETHIPTRTVLDIQGRQRAIHDTARDATNPVDRIVMRYHHDLRGSLTHQASMEAGDRWTLNDIAGKPIRGWDSRGHNETISYDPLRRPTTRTVRGTTPDSDTRTLNRDILVDKIEYGETQPHAEALNLRTRVYRHFDSAGIVINARLDTNGNPLQAYDFKGNPLHATRRLAVDYTAMPDWSTNPAVDTELFESSTRYDALNRVTQSIAPHSSLPRAKRNIIQPGYNPRGLLEHVTVWLDRDSQPPTLLDPATETPSPAGVTSINYDAKAQRLRIDYNNGASTRYRYDPNTFRLIHLHTRRGPTFTGDCDNPHPPPPTIAAPDNPPPGVPCGLQNLHYTYDPVGNITHIRDDAQRTIYFRNKRVEPSNDYTYDALYRLIRATGREHLGQDNAGAALPPTPLSYNDKPRTGLPHPGDGTAMGTYRQEYVYDEVGNFEKMIHHGSDPANPGWTRTYTYGETSLVAPGQKSNRLTSTTIRNTAETYSTAGDGYDPHGNMLRMPQLQTMQWDFQDQLRLTQRQKVNDEDEDGAKHHGERTYYVYDAAGQRVRKVTKLPTGEIKDERIYLGAFEIYRRYGVKAVVRETLQIFDDKQRIALVETRTQGNDNSPEQLIRYQLSNHLGSASVELDQQARIISYEEYYPYGSTSYQAARSQTETPHRYQYTGKERDEESGLNYHGARYYASWLGRWTSCDPAGIVDGPNLYAYVAGNPVQFIDHRGTDKKRTWVEIDLPRYGIYGGTARVEAVPPPGLKVVHPPKPSPSRASNPPLSGPSLEETARKQRETSVFPPLPSIHEPEPGRFDFAGDLGSGVFVLRHGLERALTVRNDMRYEKEKKYGKEALNIGHNTTRFTWGLQLQGSQKGEEEEGSQHNAFRHVLGMAAATEKYGPDIAREVGWQHEPNPRALNGVSDPTKLTFSDIDAADSAADLLNNKIGRQIGSDTAHPRRDMRDLAWSVLHEFFENGLWTAVPQGDGTFKIAKTTLTPAQYGAAATRLSGLDEFGFTPTERRDFEQKRTR